MIVWGQVLDTFLAALVTALATGIGALPFAFLPRLDERWAAPAYAFSGGMMLAASAFTLILPGMKAGSYPEVSWGIVAGVIFLYAVGRIVDRIPVEEAKGDGIRRRWLIMIVMFIHSFPEGVAVGVGFGTGDVALGLSITVAIAIHNIPEGIAISLPLRADGYPVWKCALMSVVSSLPQPIAAVPAMIAFNFFRDLVPEGFGFAAGAMIFLVVSEVLPHSVRAKRDGMQVGLVAMAGFIAMMWIQYGLDQMSFEGVKW